MTQGGILNGRLEQELRAPRTARGRHYMVLLMATIVGSILFLFIADEYPASFPLGSTQLLVAEAFIFAVFTVDFLLRLTVTNWRDWPGVVLLVCDGLAIVPSAMIVLYYIGAIEAAHLDVLLLLRLFRLMRVVKLLRVSSVLTDVFGASVLSLVFTVMAVHLGLRVLVMEVSNASGYDLLAFFDTPVLMIAVSAIGSAFGIALAITFGIVKNKQIHITELHRSALDALAAFEREVDAKDHGIDVAVWRRHLEAFLAEKMSYEEIKVETNILLGQIREAVHDRPTLDVPYHAVLVQSMSRFLTKTQINFHPAFYRWLYRIANLYFVLVLIAAPGLTGLVAQMLVIFVFQGLVVIIDDMDHAIDQEVTIFNSKLLPV